MGDGNYMNLILEVVREKDIDEKLQNELLLDIPQSTKHWQKGFYLDNNEIKNIEIRFRGDNSRNWLLEKKHWRIKTRKKNLINKQRYFDYLPFDHNKFLSGRIANSLGILSPKFNLVELFINDWEYPIRETKLKFG